MAKRQLTIQCPEADSPKDRVTWALEELFVLVTAGAAMDDVVTKGMIMAQGRNAHGGVHIRRGWVGGLSVSVSALDKMGRRVDVRVLPTSKLQTALLVAAFLGSAFTGMGATCALGQNGGFAMVIVGAFIGAFVGILLVAAVQRLGLGISSDANGAADALAVDIGHWADQRNAEHG